jgi:hypothetical protein
LPESDINEEELPAGWERVFDRRRITQELCFRILGIDPQIGFTQETLRGYYRIASMRHHPDRGGSDRAMAAVSAAYTFLKE